NGDGKPDLAVANFVPKGNVTVQLNTCDASPCAGISFAPPTGSPFGAGTSPASVAVGGFNGDGKPDLAAANFGDPSVRNFGNVTIRLGDGAGGFPDAKSATDGAVAGPASVAVGDFNGDGKPDLAVANFNFIDVTILLGDGTGAFPTSSSVGAG